MERQWRVRAGGREGGGSDGEREGGREREGGGDRESSRGEEELKRGRGRRSSSRSAVVTSVKACGRRGGEPLPRGLLPRLLPRQQPTGPEVRLPVQAEHYEQGRWRGELKGDVRLSVGE